MKYCEDCGTELLDDDDFCIECGILQEKICTDIVNHYCEECGTKIEDDDIFCTECGTLQFCCDNNFCEECGTALELGNIFCTECGNPIKDDSLVSDIPETNNNQFEQGIPNSYPKLKNKNISNILLKLIVIILIISILASSIYLFYVIKENNDTSSYENDITQTSTESTTEVTTEIVKEVDYNVYKEVLEKYQNSNEKSEYFLNDLNNDNIYELFIENYNDYSSTLDIYTIENRKALDLDNINIPNSYISVCQNGEVYLYWFNSEACSLSQILLKNNKIELKETIINKSDSENEPYSKVYDYLESKKEVIYDTAKVDDYSLLEDVINGVAINTKLMSYDDTSFDNDYIEESTTERRVETTTKQSETTTTEKTTEVVTKTQNNIKIPDTPLTLTLPIQSSPSDCGTVEIIDLNIDEYASYISGYIKNNNEKSISSLHLTYKIYDENGVCLQNSYIYENDMSPGEKRNFIGYIRVDYDKTISRIEFDIESSYVKFR